MGTATRPQRRRARAGKERSPAPGITIREMELADAPAVFELGSKLFTAEKWPTLYRSWDEYEVMEALQSDGELCLVAEAGERIVGFALGTMMSKPRSAWRYGWLLWLGVTPGRKRHGIGARLVNRLTELFIQQGARMMLVDTDAENHDAIEFFQRQGFGGGIHHVYLSKNLESHPKYRGRKTGGKGG